MKSVLSFFFLFPFLLLAQQFQGDNLLQILGQNRDSSERYKSFAKEWGLGRKTASPEKGLKISKNSETNRVTALIFAGKGFEINDIKFESFAGTVPFSLAVSDDYNALLSKLGAPTRDAELVSKF